MKEIGFLMLLLFSLLCAVQDIRKRSISVSLYVIFGIAGVLLCYLMERQPGSILTAMIPGSLLMILSFASRGSIGTGDALWFIVAAAYCELGCIIFILSFSWSLCMIYALVLVVRHGRNLKKLRGKKIPYLAFMPLPVIFGTML